MCSAPLTVIEICRTAASFRSKGNPRDPTPCPRCLLAAGLQRPLHVPVSLTLRDVAAFVAVLLPAGEGELDLGAAVLEVELRRDERQTLLGDLAGQGREFLLVQEELAIPVGIVVGDVSLVVGRDMGPDQPGFAVAHVSVGLLE